VGLRGEELAREKLQREMGRHGFSDADVDQLVRVRGGAGDLDPIGEGRGRDPGQMLAALCMHWQSGGRQRVSFCCICATDRYEWQRRQCAGL
jgi:hypothetical protein